MLTFIVCNIFKGISHHMNNAALLLRFGKCSRDCIFDSGQSEMLLGLFQAGN